MNWTCPYCQHNQVVTNDVHHRDLRQLFVGESRYGSIGVSVRAIRCVNTDCNDLSLEAVLVNIGRRDGQTVATGALNSWQLMPQGAARPQPDYIPKSLRDDYAEACLIRDLSPKAAATLARRCLQGMIRDFCGIAKGRLVDEVETLRKQLDDDSGPKGVESETVEAIDRVREIGNIGAHMEKDISLIVDVDPGEAQALIELIEMLFDEWYVARHKRQQRLERIQDMAAAKKADLAEQKAAKQLPAPGAEK